MAARSSRDARGASGEGIGRRDRKGRPPVGNRRALEPVPPPMRHASFAAADSDTLNEEIRDDGTIVEVRTHPLDDGGAVRTYTDITDRKAAEDRIMHLAVHDALTGLPNRRLFADALAEAIGRAKTGGGCAVLSVDLDKFK